MAPKTQVYEIRSTFRAPLRFVFHWCTDYTPEDSRLEKEHYARRILERTARRVVYEDLEETPNGWAWSRHTVTLRPPDRWHSDSVGNYREWSLDYSLRGLSDERTELTLRAVRRPVGLGSKNPPKLAQERAMRQGWKNFGKTLESDYRSTVRHPRRAAKR
ncbi:MAG TPA: hypothetical protein VEG42_03605 [Thermoplasmata archaeon]|nr:hypothetical protein [Thermoplasmata archaeon]